MKLNVRLLHDGTRLPEKEGYIILLTGYTEDNCSEDVRAVT